MNDFKLSISWSSVVQFGSPFRCPRARASSVFPSIYVLGKAARVEQGLLKVAIEGASLLDRKWKALYLCMEEAFEAAGRAGMVKAGNPSAFHVICVVRCEQKLEKARGSALRKRLPRHAVQSNLRQARSSAKPRTISTSSSKALVASSQGSPHSDFDEGRVATRCGRA